MMEALNKREYYTYADYAKWETDARYEIINGVPYMMSPAPSPKHQEISGELFGQLREFLKGKPCRVYHAPFDVRLNADKYDDTVVQPDIVVICDKSKIDKKGCKGVPDFIIEILSPSTAKMDKIIKLTKYREAGVREYWIVDPSDKTVAIFSLENKKYIANTFDETETAVPVGVLAGCKINLAEVFKDDLE